MCSTQGTNALFLKGGKVATAGGGCYQGGSDSPHGVSWGWHYHLHTGARHRLPLGTDSQYQQGDRFKVWSTKKGQHYPSPPSYITAHVWPRPPGLEPSIDVCWGWDWQPPVPHRSLPRKRRQPTRAQWTGVPPGRAPPTINHTGSGAGPAVHASGTAYIHILAKFKPATPGMMPTNAQEGANHSERWIKAKTIQECNIAREGLSGAVEGQGQQKYGPKQHVPRCFWKKQDERIKVYIKSQISQKITSCVSIAFPLLSLYLIAQ